MKVACAPTGGRVQGETSQGHPSERRATPSPFTVKVCLRQQRSSVLRTCANDLFFHATFARLTSRTIGCRSRQPPRRPWRDSECVQSDRVIVQAWALVPYRRLIWINRPIGTNDESGRTRRLPARMRSDGMSWPSLQSHLVGAQRPPTRADRQPLRPTCQARASTIDADDSRPMQIAMVANLASPSSSSHSNIRGSHILCAQ